ncbi:hypothetical protein [Streptomyces celluloflavus]|uniref:Uncharacterized protein n=1 Tax=Streptomyces celluloflavus TaxID=58344 RepID=A0ABW7RAQ8_9ACTN|nr:hypothetical protein OG717_02950 [Streptomyces celluloflavus]
MAADVPTRRAEPRVAEDAHELSPQTGDGYGVEGRDRKRLWPWTQPRP